jgi:hypothetical protein
VAPSEALYVLYRVMRPASYYRIPMANEIASNLPVFFVVADSLLLGVTMIKPTTSFFFFFRRHNRICGLAVAFKNNFLGVFPRFQKKSQNQGVLGELRQTSQNANNVIRPPPRSPSASDDSPCIYSLVANQAMQSHGGNTSACDCITRFSPWGDFHIKIVLATHAEGHDFLPFFHRR